MADNVPVNPGAGPSAGGALIATDDVGGVQFQRVKMDVGGDGQSVPVVGGIPTLDAHKEGSLLVATPAGGEALTVECTGYASAIFKVFLPNGGTYSSGHIIETSYDGGTTWGNPQICYYDRNGATPLYGNSTGNTGTTSPVNFYLPLHGASHVRLRLNGAGSGDAVLITCVVMGGPSNLVRGQVVINTENTSFVNVIPSNWLAIGGQMVSSEDQSYGNADNGWSGGVILDPTRRLITSPYCATSNKRFSNLKNVEDTNIHIVAGYAPAHNTHVGSLTIVNEGDADTLVDILDGAGTIYETCFVKSKSQEHMTFPLPIPMIQGRDLCVQCGTASQVHVTAVYFYSRV